MNQPIWIVHDTYIHGVYTRLKAAEARRDELTAATESDYNYVTIVASTLDTASGQLDG